MTTIRARYSHGVFEPLEGIELEEGQELEIEVRDKREKATLAINERIKVFAELIKKIGDISPGGDSVDDIRRERE
ncbi:MAG: antitoxin family protein [Nitrospirae bacterium]|uniref:antitoxin family protein n=1 Tax=Candidatus Magnetobacterium casense TaxID=1455061 RepID=UPI0005907A57|nr:antitoxin family protein [Candidatus Magnetobacterium casensis]MBF0338338.1 antitoxin family protein [Nitrospirota bacterium]